jgi:hypothetical protein
LARSSLQRVRPTSEKAALRGRELGAMLDFTAK